LLRFTVITLFPEMFASFLDASLLGKARAAGLIEVDFIDPRDHTTDKHRSVDDTPYGGGPGMVMKAQPLLAAIGQVADAHRILMAPVGAPLVQRRVAELAELEHIVLICGRYEGIDERVIEVAVDEIVSLGDYVVSGGEAPAMALIDAVSRLVPGVLGDAASAEDESFSAGLLEYPQYTRPAEIAGRAVPEVLLSGNHKKIAAWRRARSLERTRERRPDLFTVSALEDGDRDLDPVADRFGADRCYAILLHHPVLDRHGTVVTSSVTNLDIHDIARSATTYGLAGYLPVTPVAAQREKIVGMAETWRQIAAAEATDNRYEALAVIDVAADLDAALALIEKRCGQRVHAIATSAKPHRSLPLIGHADLRRELLSGGDDRYALVFGTGWGIADAGLSRCERLLGPILGSHRNAHDFNHLSVRSAVCATLDRLFGAPFASTA